MKENEYKKVRKNRKKKKDSKKIQTEKSIKIRRKEDRPS